MRWGWIWDNPAERAHRIVTVSPELRPPTPEELRTLLDHVAARDPQLREKALVAVVAECYVRGVSTRLVDGLVKTLGIESLSKFQVSRMAAELDEMVTQFRNRPLDAGSYTYVWIDALTEKVREGGRIINVAVVIVVGVNAEGHREVLGLDVITTEDGTGWLAFLRGLVARGPSACRW